MKHALLLFAAVAVQFAGAEGSYEEFLGAGPGKVPGAVVVGCVGGKISAQCLGYADLASKSPMTENTVGWLASNTKAIACALVLTYVEEGKLALDEPISRYLPEWQGEKVPTLRQCMSHTSGLKFFPEMPIDRRPVQLLSRLGAKGGMVSAPGEKYQYSNWGIDIAVACVEVVAGRPWEALLKERVLDPLEMRDATFFPTEEQCRRMAKGYVLTDDKPAKEVAVDQFQYPYSLHSRYPEAGGGLFGSPMDMIKFFAMVANGGVGLNGKRVLKEETVALWFEKQTPKCVGEDYSFGARVSKDRQMMSHGGAWSTWGCAYRSSGVARVFFVQYAGGESKGYERFRSLVDKDAEASYSPTAAR
jgi:CubicO group peptidase (beta-lactamase class C family)